MLAIAPWAVVLAVLALALALAVTSWRRGAEPSADARAGAVRMTLPLPRTIEAPAS